MSGSSFHTNCVAMATFVLPSQDWKSLIWHLEVIQIVALEHGTFLILRIISNRTSTILFLGHRLFDGFGLIWKTESIPRCSFFQVYRQHAYLRAIKNNFEIIKTSLFNKTSFRLAPHNWWRRIAQSLFDLCGQTWPLSRRSPGPGFIHQASIQLHHLQCSLQIGGLRHAEQEWCRKMSGI